jgi:hypothetical protein
MMSKFLGASAALAVTAVFALPAPALASTQGAAAAKPAGLSDISAARRHHHYRHHWRHPRYYGRYYYRPYNAYAYDPYYYGPYYRPGPYVAFGPLGFSFGW